MSELFQQLKDKHLVRTAIVYVGGAWLMLEATGFFVETYALSRNIIDIVVLLVVLGFPATLIIAWFHGEEGPQEVRRIEAALLLMLGVLAAVGTYRITTATEIPSGEGGTEATAPATTRLAADDLGERSIAVLPFSNATGLDSLDWVGSGVSDMLTTSLARGGDMRVVSPQRLFELLRGAGRSETDEIPDDVAMQIAGEAGARRMVRGSVLGSLDDLVLDVQLIDLSDGTVVAGDRIRGDDVFVMADSLAGWVARQFAARPRTRLASGETTPWGPSRPPPALTGDPERLKEYSLALRSAWTDEGVEGRYRVVDLLEEWSGREGEVRDALEEIVAANPSDARALGDLVRVAAIQADVVALDSLVPRYTATDEDSARARMTVGRAYERIGEWDRARDEYRDMLAKGLGRTGPLDRIVRTYLAEGRPRDARAELDRLAPDDPSLATRTRLLRADTYAWEGAFEPALAQYADLERGPSSPSRSAATESRLAIQWVLDPAEGATRLNQVIWTLLERGRHQQALNVLEGDEHLYVRNSDRLPPVDAHVLLYERARTMESMGATEAALSGYDELLDDWGDVLGRLPLLADVPERRAALAGS